MLRGIFMDYTGTMVREDGEYTRQLIAAFLAHSTLKDPKAAVATVWRMIKRYESESFGENFVTEDVIVDRILSDCREQYGLDCDFAELHRIWQLSWVHAPLFDDVKPFFERCPLPVYILTNDSMAYIEESMRLKDLHPAGIVSSETVRACKPHRAVFEGALRLAGLAASEVLHVGDSVESDVKGALSAGIRPVLLDRTGKQTCDDAPVIRSLPELLELPEIAPSERAKEQI